MNSCSPQHAEYLTIVAYVNTKVPASAHAFAEIIQRLSLLGIKRSGQMTFHQDLEHSKKHGNWFPNKATRLDGSSLTVTIKFPSSMICTLQSEYDIYTHTAHEAHVYSRERSNADTWTNFLYVMHYHSLAGGMRIDETYDPCIIIMVRTDVFASEKDQAPRAFVDAVMEILNRHCTPYSGHVEITPGVDIAFGTYYGGLIRQGSEGASWQRLLDHEIWMMLPSPRKHHVRGVHWGTFLGPDLARRFDGDVGRLEQFDNLRRLHFSDRGPQYVTRYENGAAFLALGDTPAAMSRRFNRQAPLPVGVNAARLHFMLREAGLLP